MRSGSCHARRLRARGATRKRQQGDVARALDGHAESALVPRAHAGHAAGQNFAALLHELRKNVRALVVDEVHLLDAKLADFLFAEILALAAGTPPWPAGASRATFAASAAAGAAFPPWTTAPFVPGTSAAFVARTTPAGSTLVPWTSAFMTRCCAAAWRWCWFLIVWHTYHPSEF